MLHRLLPSLTVLVLVFVAFGVADADGVSSPSPVSQDPPLHGMTVSCQTWGGEWGTDAMVETMAELKAMGVNWIAIHPYAGIAKDGTVSLSGWRYDDTSWLTRPIAEAHKLGMRIFIKPHLAHWGSGFQWRGAITFDTPEAWARFFETYTQWITAVARITRDADAFCVGTELAQTASHDARWRRVIESVRGETDAPLTFAANWDRYQLVKFWDALDAIGVQAYFPVAHEAGMAEPVMLAAAWDVILDKLDAFAAPLGKTIVFTELGYDDVAGAPLEPWRVRGRRVRDEDVQACCMAAALQAIDRHPSVCGAFLWKWFAGPARRASFLMSTPRMRETIEVAWSDGSESVPASRNTR